MSSRRRLLGATSLVVAMLSSSLVLRTSTAAFTASTVNTGNTWTAGTVALSDDDNGSALFSAAGMYPSTPPVTRCIRVTYTGTLPSSSVSVKLYGALLPTPPSATPSPLAPYLNLTIERGSVPGANAAGSCENFVASPSAAVYTGTLADFTSTKTTFGTGVDDWAPAPGAVATYRLSLSVQDTNDAQGKTAAASFTWESQSR